MKTTENPAIFENVVFTKINEVRVGNSKPSTILPLVCLLSLQMRMSFKDAEKHLIQSVKYN